MKKRDVMLATAILAAALFLILIMQRRKSGQGNEIQITVNGVLYGTYLLSEEQTIPVMQEMGKNIVHIKDGEVWMEEADCPDGYCMRKGSISLVGENIVCLPHRLVVTVMGEKTTQGENNDAPDAVVH